MKDKQQEAGGEKELRERQKEATSSQTLSDVKREEKVSDMKRSGQDTSVPSPDGTPDPERGSGRADGSDTGGPM
ncbi:MAG: hypothetical protein ABI596_11360 [Pyrinomonadaceae bacterium]